MNNEQQQIADKLFEIFGFDVFAEEESTPIAIEPLEELDFSIMNF